MDDSREKLNRGGACFPQGSLSLSGTMLEIGRMAGTATAIGRLGFLPPKAEGPLQGLGLGRLDYRTDRPAGQSLARWLEISEY